MSSEHEATLNQLLRAIALSSGEFALLLARCNSAAVRDRLIEALQARLGTELYVWTATPEMGAVNVVDGLAAAPAGTQAACVTGLESLPLLNDILAIANNAREEFRKRLAFPVVVWVTDEVEGKLRRRSPDLASWAAPPFVFALDRAELQAILERETADVLDWAFLPEGKPGVPQELLGAWQEWQRSGAELAPEVKARVALAFGMEAGSAEAAQVALEQCLARVERGVLAAAARYRLGLWWEQQGKLNRAAFLEDCRRAQEYWQGAWADPAGKHPNVALALGGVLLALALVDGGAETLHSPPKSLNSRGLVEAASMGSSERWEAVAVFADQLEMLPGFVGGLRAEVALAWRDFATARREAERALQTDDPDRTGLYLLALGRSLIGLDRAKEAITALEQAKELVVPEIDPDLHIRILRALHGAYTAAKDYRRAFAVKCDHAAVETQYGFRAFMGAGRLRPQRRVGALGEAATEEIAASGRQADIDALVERVKRNDCRLTVVHGPSGVGKSSLIQAGLVPALRKVIHQSRSVVPVVIEHYEDWQGEFAQKLQAIFPKGQFEESHSSLHSPPSPPILGGSDPQSPSRFGGSDPQSPAELGDLGGECNDSATPQLLTHLHTNDRRNLITVLIFDQFEEFFFKHPNVPGRRQLYDFLRDCLDIPYVWVFLSLREDYVHYLLECDRLANLTLINNDILNKNVRYYLGNFSQERAKAVIRELTEKSPYRLEEGLIDRWVADLAADLGEVRPIELQVVGAQMVQGEKKVLTLAAYEALGDRPKQALVERWLTEVVRDCGEENEELAQRVLFALTEEPEKRPAKTKTELKRDVNLLTPALSIEEREQAIQGDLDYVLAVPIGAGLAFEIPATPEACYQLIHDYLVPPIRQQFGVKLTRQLEEERKKRKLAEDQKAIVTKQNQRLIVSIVIAAFMAVIAAGAGGIAFRQKDIADQQTKIAKTQKEIADNQRRRAEEQKKLADIRRDEAEKQKGIAEQQRKLAKKRQGEAEKQKGIAEQQRKLADQQRGEAQNDKIKADQQKRLAQAAQLDADRQRAIAEQQRQIALRQRDVASKAKDEANKAKLAQSLSAQALALRDVFPQRSLLLGVESIRPGILSKTDAGALLRRLLGDIGGIPLIGHEKPVVAVAFTLDGKRLATGSQDGTVRLWDKVNPDHPPMVLQGKIGEIKAIAISPDGKWLAATGNKDTKIQLWNLTSTRVNTESLMLPGHTAAINTLSFSPDGTWLATGSEDKTVRLWSMKTTVPGDQQILLKHGDSIRQVAFSGSGRWLATSEGNSGDYSQRQQDIRLWDLKTINNTSTPTILKTQPYIENIVLGLAFSPDEKHLAAAISYSVQVWDLTAKNLSANSSTIVGTDNGWISAIAFSPDSRWLATGINDLKLWDLRSLDPAQPRSPDCQTDPGYSVCRFFLRGHTAYIVSLNFNPKGKWLASASTDGTARLWDITDLSIPPVVLRGHESSVNAISFDSEGQWLATASQDTQARLWKVPDVLGDPIVYRGSQNGVTAVALSTEWVAVAGSDNIIRLWSRTNPLHPPILLTGHARDIYHVAFAPNGRWLASASVDGTVRLWSMTNPAAPSHNLMGPSFWSMAFSRSGRWLAAGSFDGTVRLWDMNSTLLPIEPIHVLDTQNLGVRSLAFSPDEHHLVTGGNGGFCTDRNTMVWDLTLKNPNTNPLRLPGNCDVVADVAFSPDNHWMATAAWDGTARIWDLQAANPSTSMKAIKFDPDNNRVGSVAFSPNGHLLAAGSWNRQVQVQDMTQLTRTPSKLLGHQARVFDVEFSPNGDWLATASEDHTIRLWNPKDLKVAPIILRGHDSEVSSLAFSSDSRWLLSSGKAGNDARLWRLNEEDLITIACRTAGRNLTPEEWQRFLPEQPYRATCPTLSIIQELPKPKETLTPFLK